VEPFLAPAGAFPLAFAGLVPLALLVSLGLEADGLVDSDLDLEERLSGLDPWRTTLMLICETQRPDPR
jgi:hypothetical protein